MVFTSLSVTKEKVRGSPAYHSHSWEKSQHVAGVPSSCLDRFRRVILHRPPRKQTAAIGKYNHISSLTYLLKKVEQIQFTKYHLLPRGSHIRANSLNNKIISCALSSFKNRLSKEGEAVKTRQVPNVLAILTSVGGQAQSKGCCCDGSVNF